MKSETLKVVFVNPPFVYFPGAGKSSPNYSRPPLGIAYLASYVKQYLGHPVELALVDCPGENLNSAADVARRVAALRPDAIGLSVVTATRDVAGELAERWRAACPGVPVILGGPHITALPDEPAPFVDALIVGEGEQTIVEYLQKRVLQQSTEEILGCRLLHDGMAQTPLSPRPFIEPLDHIPIPARELLPNDAYVHSYPQRYRRFTTMFTSRGCPFNCSFCSNEALWRGTVRYHSAARIREEIDRVMCDLGVDLIFFEDDTFLANRALSSAVMAYLRTKRPALSWVCHTRADTLSAETLAEMEASGCVEIQIGVESGNQEILDKTDKRLRLETVRHAFQLLRRTRIKSWATFILGNEGETRETFKQTLNLALEIDPSYASMIILLPFPGSRAFRSYADKGYLTTYRWSDYSWHGDPVFSLPHLSSAQLVKLRSRAYRRFYLRPRKLLHIFMDVVKASSLREILRNMRFWLSLSKSKPIRH